MFGGNSGYSAEIYPSNGTILMTEKLSKEKKKDIVERRCIRRQRLGEDMKTGMICIQQRRTMKKKTEVKLTRNIKMMKKTEVHKQEGVIIMENEGW